MQLIMRTLLALGALLLSAAAPALARQHGTPQQVLLAGDAAARAAAAADLGKQGFPVDLVREYAAFSIGLYQFQSELTEDQFAAAVAALNSSVVDGGLEGGDFNQVLGVERGGGQTGSLWVTGLGRPEFDAQYGFNLTDAACAADRATGLGVTVAIIDAGLVPGAPMVHDYALDRGYDFVAGSGGAAGIPEDVGDGIDNNANDAVDEGVGHGSFIASLIARIAPGARHLHLKVLDDEGECEVSDILAALEVCLAENVHVVNLSVVPTTPTTILKGAFTALRQNGTIVVTSAGNLPGGGNPFGTSEQDLIQVGATTHADAAWGGSATGSWIDIFAPGATEVGPKGEPLDGQCVVGVAGLGRAGGTDFVAASGTSFAAAFVSGAAACFRAANPSWPQDASSGAGAVTADQISGRFRAALVASAATLPGGSPGSSLKRLDAGALVAGLAPVPRCPGDIARAPSGEGPEFLVNGVDLADLLVRFGAVLTDPRRIERANLEPSTPERIDANDLAALLARWGSNRSSPCP